MVTSVVTGPPGFTRRAGRLETGGELLSYEITGDGTPVVLTHGLGGNHGSWWRQVLPFAAAGHAVVTWDQRGFGNSTRVSGPFGPRPAVDDLEALLDHLGLGPVDLVGQSMGGWVAMGLALRRPELLRSLVITDTLAGVFTDAIGAHVQRSMAAGGPLRSDLAGRHPALGEPFRQRHPDLAVLYETISGYGDKPPDAEVFGLLGSTRYPLEQVAALALPTLAVVGELDQLCPPEAMAVIAGLIPGARLEVVAGCGHSPYFEDPDRWNELVLGFIHGL